LTAQALKQEKPTPWELTLSALLAAILAAVFCLFISFLLIRAANGHSDTAMLILEIYWKGSLTLIGISAILGFIFSGPRMIHFVGIIFRTNKPKDGNWL